MSSEVRVAGADILRGDIVKLTGGKLFPARLGEPHIGAASQSIPSGAEAIRTSEGHWRRAPRKGD